MKRRGSTLIEVLAAMVLIAVVLPVSMKAVGVVLRSASQARHVQEASMLAELKINEVLALDDLTLVGNAGTFGDAYPQYRWELATAVTDFSCYEVIVTIYWPERGAERSYELTGLYFPSGTTTTTLTTGGLP